MRDRGVQNAVIAHAPDGVFDVPALQAQAAGYAGMVGNDLVPDVTTAQRFDWDETVWSLGEGFGRQEAPRYKVVAVDYGIKRNILRLLAEAGCAVTVVPATASAEDILALEPDGVFLSNGPGDPAATGDYAVPVIQDLLERRVPTFGICLGHQLHGARHRRHDEKMHQGHHGANHPVMDYTTDKVEIVSMNHGFAVAGGSLPANARETHKSAVRRLELRPRTDRPAGLLRAAPPGSLPRPARQPLPLHALHRADGRGQEPRHDRLPLGAGARRR